MHSKLSLYSSQTIARSENNQRTTDDGSDESTTETDKEQKKEYSLSTFGIPNIMLCALMFNIHDLIYLLLCLKQNKTKLQVRC